MKDGNRHSGYTIVEALIFLAVSALIMISTLMVVSGKLRRTEFTQATQDIRSQLDDISNDVANGYYTNTNDFRCYANPIAPFPKPNLTPNSSNEQGANEGCVFLGRAVQFSVSNQRSNYNVYTVVGRQSSGANITNVATNLTDSKPVSTFPYASTTSQLENGLQFAWMEYVDSSGTTQRGSVTGIGYLADLSAYSYSGGSLNSGSQSTSIIPIVGTTADSPSTFGNAIENVPVSSAITGTNRPIRLCFNSGGTNQHAIISLSTDGGRATTDLTIGNGVCA